MMVLSLAFQVASGDSSPECEGGQWRVLQGAMERGDARAIAALMGRGTVSLGLDGIAPGNYTAAQATRLLGEFFRATTDRRLEYRACGISGATAWADAVYRYRTLGTDGSVVERLLLEFCGSGDEAALCGMRSSSPSARVAS